MRCVSAFQSDFCSFPQDRFEGITIGHPHIGWLTPFSLSNDLYTGHGWQNHLVDS